MKRQWVTPNASEHGPPRGEGEWVQQPRPPHDDDEDKAMKQLPTPVAAPTTTKYDERMCINMSRNFYDYSQRRLADSQFAGFVLREHLTNCEWRLPLTSGDDDDDDDEDSNSTHWRELETYFGASGHAMAIDVHKSYVVPLILDIDCQLCAKRVQHSIADASTVHVMCAEIRTHLATFVGDTDEVDVNNVTIMRRRGSCGIHLYFALSLSVTAYGAIVDWLRTSLSSKHFQHYVIDFPDYLPLPFSAKRDGENYQRSFVSGGGGGGGEVSKQLPHVFPNRKWYELSSARIVSRLSASPNEVRIGTYKIRQALKRRLDAAVSEMAVKTVHLVYTLPAAARKASSSTGNETPARKRKRIIEASATLRSTPLQLCTTSQPNANRFKISTSAFTAANNRALETLINAKFELDDDCQVAPLPDIGKFLNQNSNDDDKESIRREFLLVARALSEAAYHSCGSATSPAEWTRYYLGALQHRDCGYATYILGATVCYIQQAGSRLSVTSILDWINELILSAISSDNGNRDMLQRIILHGFIPETSALEPYRQNPEEWIDGIAFRLRLELGGEGIGSSSSSSLSPSSSKNAHASATQEEDPAELAALAIECETMAVEYILRRTPILKQSRHANAIFVFEEYHYVMYTSIANAFALQHSEHKMARALKLSPPQYKYLRPFIKALLMTEAPVVTTLFNDYPHFINTSQGVFNKLTNQYMVHVPMLYFNTCILSPFIPKSDLTCGAVLGWRQTVQSFIDSQAQRFYSGILVPGLLELACGINQIAKQECDLIMQACIPIVKQDKNLHVTDQLRQPLEACYDFDEDHLRLTRNRIRLCCAQKQTLSLDELASIKIAAIENIEEETVTVRANEEEDDTDEAGRADDWQDALAIVVCCLEALLLSDDSEALVTKVHAAAAVSVSPSSIDEAVPLEHVCTSVSIWCHYDSRIVGEFLRTLAQFMCPANPRKQFLVLIGPAYTGKSNCIRWLEAMSQGAYYSSKIGMVGGRKNDSSAATPADKEISTKYLVTMSEMTKASANELKCYTGGDTMNIRGLYENDFRQVRATAFLVAATNGLPRIDDACEALRCRLAPFEFSFRFVPEDELTPIDENPLIAFAHKRVSLPVISNRDAAQALLQLVYGAFLLYKNSNGQLDMPTLTNKKSIELIGKILEKNQFIYSILTQRNVKFHKHASISAEELHAIIREEANNAATSSASSSGTQRKMGFLSASALVNEAQQLLADYCSADKSFYLGIGTQASIDSYRRNHKRKSLIEIFDQNCPLPEIDSPTTRIQMIALLRDLYPSASKRQLRDLFQRCTQKYVYHIRRGFTPTTIRQQQLQSDAT